MHPVLFFYSFLVGYCLSVPGELKAQTNLPRTATGKTDFSGGDYERGRELFLGRQLKCADCHRIRSDGIANGSDLSNQVTRDGAAVLRDIMHPASSVNPHRIPGKQTGLLDLLEENQVRDLMTFLLHEPPRRTKMQIDNVRKDSKINSSKLDAVRTLSLVLVASKQDHGPGQHDYPAWQVKWQKLLDKAPGVTVTNAWEWPTDAQFQKADALIFYFWNHDWNAARLRQIDDFLARGGGIVLLHSAVIADKDPEQLAERIGLAAQPVRTKYLHAPLELKLVSGENAITRGFKSVPFLDEPYWPLIGDTNKVTVLGTTIMDDAEHPLMWTFRKGKGRVFASILGHYTWTGDDPLFRILIQRGLAWSCGENEYRFDNLVSGQ